MRRLVLADTVEHKKTVANVANVGGVYEKQRRRPADASVH